MTVNLDILDKQFHMERIGRIEKSLALLRLMLAPEMNFGNPQAQDQAAGAYFLIEKLEKYMEDLRKRYENNP